MFPAIYKNHLEQFKELVKSDDPALGDMLLLFIFYLSCGLTHPRLVTESLNALARFVKTFPDDSPQDE